MSYQKQPNEALIASKPVGWNAALDAAYTAGAVRFTINSIAIGGLCSWECDFVAVGDATLPDGTIIPNTTVPGSATTPTAVNTALIAAATPVIQALPNITITG